MPAAAAQRLRFGHPITAKLASEFAAEDALLGARWDTSSTGGPRDLPAGCKRLPDKVPPEYRTFADQLLRSGGRVPLLIAAGCCRRTPDQKRQRFGEARGECGEAGAAAEVLAVLGLVPVEDARQVHDLASRESAILFGMVRRFTR